MSLIAYCNGLLLADRVGKKERAGIEYLIDMQKLHTSPTKQFAMALCGGMHLPRNLTRLHDSIYAALILHKHTPTGTLPITDDDRKLLIDRSVIIMTSDSVFISSSDCELAEVDVDDWAVCGTIGAPFRVALAAGIGTLTAANVAAEHVTGLKGCKIDYIARESLLPIFKAEEPTS